MLGDEHVLEVIVQGTVSLEMKLRAATSRMFVLHDGCTLCTKIVLQLFECD